MKRASQWARIGAACCLLGLGTSASAASVDLTVVVNVPTTTTLQPFTYTVVVGNALTGSVATNAQVSIPLPANLYDISVQSVAPSGPAATACPAPAAFGGLPAAGSTTDGSQTLTATVPSLPATGFCTITIAATPLQANSYTMTASVGPSAGDSETNPTTNTAQGNTATALSVVPLKVDKTIVGGATAVAGTTNRYSAAAYGSPVTYALTFENQSGLALPLGSMGDTWADWEGNWAPQSTPVSASTTLQSCVIEGLDGPLSGSCPAVEVNTSGLGTDIEPIWPRLTGYVMPPRSRITITYQRTYQAPVCGNAIISNNIAWNVNRNGNFIQPQWHPEHTSATVLAFDGVSSPPQPRCTELTVRPVLSKTLDRVVSSNGAERPAFGVLADGDMAEFRITIDNTQTDAAGWPAGAEAVPFSIWDVVRSMLGDAVSPSFFPDGSVTQQVFYGRCEIAPGDTVSQCPAATPGQALNTPSTNFRHGQSAVFTVAAGRTMVLRFSTRYSMPAPVKCVRNNVKMENFVGLNVRPSPVPGHAYVGTTYQERTTADKVTLLPDTPRCADVSSNKTMTPTNPRAGESITFTLDYVNSTALATGNPYNAPSPLTDVGVADVLGRNFRATAVSCSTIEGTATPPSVSLADITGPDNTFSTVIPSMDDGAVVRCQITGSVSLPGSYHNTTAIALANGSALMDPYTSNNVSSLNYGIIGPRVALTKTGSVSGNTVTFSVTARSAGEVAADGTRVSDVMPAGVQNPTWTCASAGGATCPAAAGSGNIDQPIDTFPSGSSVTWTIQGTLTPSISAATVTNQAQAAPPVGSSCVTANPADPPTAPPCLASAAVDAPVTPQVAVGTAFAPGATPTPNGTVGYTVTFSNPGAAAANGAQLSDPVPAGVASQTWTCAGEGGAVCPAGSGSGPITGTVTTFPAGGRLIYTVTATLTSTPPATLTNNAQITPPTGGVCAGGGAGPCTASASITAAGQGGGGVTAVPVDAPWALALLSALIGLGFARRRAAAGRG